MKKLVRIFMLCAFLMSLFTMQTFAEVGQWRNGNFTDDDTNDVRIMTYVQGKGWMGPFHNKETAGTTGESRRIEALSIQIFDGTPFEYRVYVEGLGWSDWVSQGTKVGTVDEKRAILGIEMRCPAQNRVLSYRAHVAEVGWTDYVMAGEEDGETAGNLKNRVEAITIKYKNLDKIK